MKLTKLLLITLLSISTLFAGFSEVNCTKESHYKDILHITQGDCQALEAFWVATGEGTGWKKSDNWGKLKSADTWYGITLSDDNASVKILNLKYNNVTGKIPEEIGNFTNLKELILPFNHLSGSIPMSIEKLVSLEKLRFEDNNFSGSLPKLTQLINLKFLGLSGNNFTGTIPSEYAQLTKLEYLDVFLNKLSGSIPDFSNLPLNKFHFANNRFTFADIEPQIEWIKKVSDAKYEHQHDIDEKEHPVVYFDHVLNIEPSLAYNKNDLYTWIKDGKELTVDAARIYSKTNATKAEDEGFYVYEVRNSVVTRDYDGGRLFLHGTKIQAIHDNTPKVSNKSPLTQTTEDKEYTYTSDISDADPSDTLTVTATALPAWLTLTPEANNFTLSGTPTSDDLGSHDINLTITDGKIPVHINYTLVVKSATQPNHAPTIAGTPKTEVNAGEPYTFTPTAKDVDSDDTLTYTITNKPSWATFDPATGTLSGTPKESDVKSYTNITITVSDSLEKATLPVFSINVKSLITPNTTPSITGTPDTVVNAEEPYSFTPTAKDKDGDTLTYSITHKPSWASFNASTGALTGTPQESDVGTTANIIISVSDAKATASLPAFSINVRAAGTVTPPPPPSPVKSSGGDVNLLGFGLLFVLLLLGIVGREGRVNKVK